MHPARLSNRSVGSPNDFLLLDSGDPAIITPLGGSSAVADRPLRLRPRFFGLAGRQPSAMAGGLKFPSRPARPSAARPLPSTSCRIRSHCPRRVRAVPTRIGSPRRICRLGGTHSVGVHRTPQPSIRAGGAPADHLMAHPLLWSGFRPPEGAHPSHPRSLRALWAEEKPGGSHGRPLQDGSKPHSVLPDALGPALPPFP